MIDKKEKNILIGVGAVVLIAVFYFVFIWKRKTTSLDNTKAQQIERPYWMNKPIDELTRDEMIGATVFRIKQNKKWYQKVKDKVDPSKPIYADVETALINDAKWIHKKDNGWEDTKAWLIKNGYMS